MTGIKWVGGDGYLASASRRNSPPPLTYALSDIISVIANTNLIAHVFRG